MPVITLECGSLSKEQKKQLVEEFTTIASKIMNTPKQAYVVLLKENDHDNIGVGGQLLSDSLSLSK